MKSKIEIVIETLKFYNKNNRGYNAEAGHCTYYDESTGNKCAVGRCIDDSAIKKVSDCEKENIKKSEISPSVDTLDGLFGGLDNLLKPEYRGHDTWFWQNLQAVHDSHSFWNEDGFDLSARRHYLVSFFGKEVADAVKEAFNKESKPNLLEKTA